jgi:Na+-translocating ferredoxin:NAD+ oxidoreductase subunit C
LTQNTTGSARHKLKGGHKFSLFAGVAEPTLDTCPAPGSVVLPLSISGQAWSPTVENGSSVRAGEPLLSAGDDSGIVLSSPLTGTVTVSDESVVVTGDGSDAATPSPDHVRAPWHLDRKELLARFRSTGCALLLDTLFADKAACDRITTVIVSAVHTTPLDCQWSPDMLDDPGLVADGLAVVGSLFPDAHTIVAVTKAHAARFKALGVEDVAEVVTLSNRYPQEHPELLARDAAGIRLTSPEGHRDPSVLVIRIFDLVQIAEVLTRGLPLIDRIMMIAGPGISRPGWYRVLNGTPLSHIMISLGKDDSFGPWRVIRGDVFTGTTAESTDAPVLPNDRAISVIREESQRELWRFTNPGIDYDSYPHATLASLIPFMPRRLGSGRHGGVRPCVQCNYCDEVCPVDIYPHLIWKYMEAEDPEGSFRFRPYDCIDCRLCDYVCPSKIDISVGVQAAAAAYQKAKGGDETTD